MEGVATAASASFHGFISDHYDALLLVTAARLGHIPRFRRRLDITEQRDLILSGSIFLWNEEESYMKRWTDGYPWSPSRIQHKFLVYREMAQRGCARMRTSARAAHNMATSNEEGLSPSDDRHRKMLRSLTGSLFNEGELEELQQWFSSGMVRADDIFKRGGLIKKTFTVAIPGETWHLVAYYTLEDVLAAKFPMPKENPFFRSLPLCDAVTGMHDESEHSQIPRSKGTVHGRTRVPARVYDTPPPMADINFLPQPNFPSPQETYSADPCGQDKYYYPNSNSFCDDSLSVYSLPPSPLTWTPVPYESTDPRDVSLMDPSSFTPYPYIAVGSD